MRLTFDTLPTMVGEMYEKLTKIEQHLVPTTDSKQVSTPALLINSQQFCDHFKISMPTLIRWRKKSKISFIKLGGSIRYDLNTVIAELEIARRNR